MTFADQIIDGWGRDRQDATWEGGRLVPGGLEVNAQTGTTYTVLASDRKKLVTHTNASDIAVTLPQATGDFGANFHYWEQNRGAGTVTITPTTSTIDGAATLALTTNQGCLIVSDGTNYFTMRGVGSASGGTGNGGMFRVRVATTANGTLASAFDNGSTVDGVTIATGDVLLLKNQTDATENGVYTAVASGAPTRVADFETGDTVHAYIIAVAEGTTNGDSVWMVTNATGSDVVDTDNLTFARLGSGGPGLLNVRTSTGAKTAGAVRAIVEVQAGGGGGGGVDSVTGTTNVARASGGGGGGYIKHYISDLSAITTYTITTGSGGSGGAAGANNGTAGGNSVYSDGTTTLTANGGGLGQGSTGATTSGTLAGGAGGSASGGNLMNVTGQNGTDGCRFSVADPGGGTMSQNNGFPNGGNSQLGLGGIAPPTVGTASAAGVAGTGYGGGGSGAVSGNSSTDRAGGNGAAGLVLVWEYGYETTAFDASVATLAEVAPATGDKVAGADASNSNANCSFDLNALAGYVWAAGDPVAISGATTATINRWHEVANAAAYTITLPAVSGNDGKFLGFVFLSTLTTIVTLDGNGAETIISPTGRADTTRKYVKGEVCVLRCNGSAWQVVHETMAQISFEAYPSAATTSISGAAAVLVANDTEAWDTGSCYDNSASNYKFTPTAPGLYAVSLQGGVDNLPDAKAGNMQLYKNGALFKLFGQNIVGGLIDLTVGGCALVSMNGSTDYLQAYIRHNHSSNLNYLGGDQIYTYFSAWRVCRETS